MIIFSLLLGGSFFLLSWVSYEGLKPWVDWLARDSSVESFNPVTYDLLSPILRWIGFGLMILGAGFLIARDTTQTWLDNLWRLIQNGWVIFRRDIRQLASLPKGIKIKDKLTLALGAIILLAIASRWAFICKPFSYDESYTLIAFAMKSMRSITADYHLPNNHIFHTILVHYAYQIFGLHPWSVRLPAFIAGILLIPAGYLAAASLYDRYTALLTAGFIASSWVLIDFSTNARGYTLISLITLLMLALAVHLKNNKNLAAWLLLAILAALGFYTVPIMLYPFGIIMTWLLLSCLFGDINPEYGKSFFLYLIALVALAVILTLALYLPVFRTSGIQAVINNPTVKTLGWSAFRQNVPGKITAVWKFWTQNWPVFLGPLMLISVGISLIFHRRLSSQRIHLLLPTILSLGTILIIQQVTPLPKIWLFLLPLTLIWTSAGMIILLKALPIWDRPDLNRRMELSFIILVLGLTVFLSWSFINALLEKSAFGIGNQGDAEQTALFLKGELQPGDAVMATVPVNYPLRYYFLLHEVPTEYLYWKDSRAEYKRVFVVVNKYRYPTLESTIEKNEPDNILAMSSAKEVYRLKSMVVYEMTK